MQNYTSIKRNYFNGVESIEIFKCRKGFASNLHSSVKGFSSLSFYFARRVGERETERFKNVKAEKKPNRCRESHGVFNFLHLSTTQLKKRKRKVGKEKGMKGAFRGKHFASMFVL